MVERTASCARLVIVSNREASCPPSPVRYTTRIIVPPRVKRSNLPGGYGSKPKAQVLGVRKTIGFGDRLGSAADAHVGAAAAHPDFAPVFAQQSGDELAAAGRTLQDAFASAARGVDRGRFRAPWGADADRLRTPLEVEQAAGAGFTYFTIDPGEWIASDTDSATPEQIVARIDRLVADGDLPEDWFEPYLNRTIELPGSQRLQLALDPLHRAAAKFGYAIRHCARMAETAARACHGRPYELEVMFGNDGTRATTPLEHLFVGLELEARGIRIVSAGLQFGPGFEPAADFLGDPFEFEARLRQHAAVADFCGPHKLAFREASYKETVYPVIGRTCGDALHIKTSGMSYLEGLRVIARVEPDLFAGIVRTARIHFDQAAAASAIAQSVRDLPDAESPDAERIYLDQAAGRQMLHATFGYVLANGRDEAGQPFRERILELLERHADIYREVLTSRLENMFGLLAAG